MYLFIVEPDVLVAAVHLFPEGNGDIHIWTMSAVGTEILFKWKNYSLMSPWSSQKMLCLVPLDTPIGKGDILSGDRPVFLLVGSMLVFLGTEMALGVSGLASFYSHNGKVNWGQPSGLIPISSTDGLFYFGSTFSALGESRNKILHLFYSCGKGTGSTNWWLTIWSGGAQLGLREKQLCNFTPS